ncbi:hypothetical protein D3C76_1605300 [compost metagenome]
MAGVVSAAHCSATTSSTAAVKARPPPIFLDFGELHWVVAVTFMGSARHVAAVCIRAPSFSIQDPSEEDGGQTEAGVIGFARTRIEDCEFYKITGGVQMNSCRFFVD